MEISVNTRLKNECEFKVDIHIEGMPATRLATLDVDAIREMVRPQIKAILTLEDPKIKEETAEKLSRHAVYGVPQSQSDSGEGDEGGLDSGCQS